MNISNFFIDVSGNSGELIKKKIDLKFAGGCKTNCVTARFKDEELTAPQTQS